MTWVARGEVEPDSARLEREQEHGHVAGLEVVDHVLAPRRVHAAVQEPRRDAAAREMLLEEASHRDVLGEDEHGVAGIDDGVDQLVERGELSRPAARAARAGRGTARDGS